MASYDIYHTVTDILHTLKSVKPDIDWTLQCSYSDGQGQTIMEISFYTTSRKSRHGIIAYQQETGEVHNFFYSGLKGRRAESVVDVILDILNLEKQRNNKKTGEKSSSRA